MWQELKCRMSAFNDAYGRFTETLSNPTTAKQLVQAIFVFGGAWAIAWNAHIIGPWLNDLFGWLPNDPDSAGKVRWRRIWSTAICLPGILAGIGLYIRNRRQG